METSQRDSVTRQAFHSKILSTVQSLIPIVPAIKQNVAVVNGSTDPLQDTEGPSTDQQVFLVLSLKLSPQS